jgi:hypothetical protein
MPEWLQNIAAIESNLTLGLIFGRLSVAAVLGMLIAVIYFGSQRRTAGEVFPVAATMVLLTILVAMTTLVIGNNVARAFSLVGALSIVRFRTIVEDTRDTAFVIFSVVVGMAVGAGDLQVCLAGVPIVGATSLLLHAIEKYSRRLVPERKLDVRIIRDCDPMTVLAGAFSRHLTTHRLVSATTAKQGQSIELRYLVRLTHADDVLPLLRSLQVIDGVESIEINGV